MLAITFFSIEVVKHVCPKGWAVWLTIEVTLVLKTVASANRVTLVQTQQQRTKPIFKCI